MRSLRIPVSYVVLAALMASSGCKTSSPGGAARVLDASPGSDDGTRTTKLADYVKGISLGQGYDGASGQLKGSTCVAVEDGNIQNPPAAPAPKAPKAPTGANLADMSDDDHLNAQRNPFEDYLAWSDAQVIEGDAENPGAGLFLDGAPGAAPGSTPITVPVTTVQSDELLAACKNESVVNWAKNYIGKDSAAAGGIVANLTVTQIRSAQQLAKSLGISGSVNVNLVKGIGIEGNAEFRSAMSFKSDNVLLMIDSLALKGPAAKFKGDPQGTDAAIALSEDERKEQCGDQFVSSVAKGSRYTTMMTVSTSDANSPMNVGGGGALKGLQIGSASIGGSAKIDVSSINATSRSELRDESFLVTNSNIPRLAIADSACKLLIATALPRATQLESSEPLTVKFGLSKYTSQTFKKGNGAPVSKSPASEVIAEKYVKLIGDTMRFAGELYEVYNNRILYLVTKKQDIEKVDTVYKDMFAVLTGGSIDGPHPEDLWREQVSNIGGLIKAQIASAVGDIARFERGDKDAEQKASANLIAFRKGGNVAAADPTTGDDFDVRQGIAAMIQAAMLAPSQAGGQPAMPLKAGGALYYMQDNDGRPQALDVAERDRSPCQDMNQPKKDAPNAENINRMNQKLDLVFRNTNKAWKALRRSQVEEYGWGFANFLGKDLPVDGLNLWVVDDKAEDDKNQFIVYNVKDRKAVSNIGPGTKAYQVCFRSSR